MRIDLTATEAWGAVSDQYRLALGFHDPALQVQVYFGYQHALLEVSHEVARLFSHKKTIAVVGPAEPAFEQVLISFAEDGYVIKSLTSDEAADPQWFSAIQNELLFVLFANDDPVTGRIYDNSKVVSALKDKRVFLLSLSHAFHRIENLQKPEPFEVRILSLRADRALMVAGGRCRISPPIASSLPWKIENVETIQSDIQVISSEEQEHSRQLIESFESSLPEGFKAYFVKGERRIFDRCVIYHPQIDGCALAMEIADDMKIKLSVPGEETPLDSTSPCRWLSPKISQWLMNRGESEEKIRGLLIASSELLEKGLEESLLGASERILQLQQG